ncbi:hypothetical protein NP233_g5567 [Leucocoprinus birnbaumii]|uniref:Uncharacterized protein n=1 Tax=Leucocoprinus birnbaumii TaxID=56174 RepID=A0AAD5VW40_9AGAR|nr:hypothetical protein NP233_g5567 [Leucocoprinus birnbaumii]
MATVGVDPTLEYLEIGSMVAMTLFVSPNLSIVRERRSDPRRLKLFVVGLWILEFVHTFLSGYSIVILTISGKNDSLADIHRINSFSGLVASTITSCSQIWFAYRLQKLSECLAYPRLCMLISVAKFASFSALAIYQIVVVDTGDLWNQLLLIPSILACLGDLLITLGLIRSPIDRVLIWCLETNLLTCVSTTLGFILYELNGTVKVNYVWVPLTLVNCRLYSICIFASLIARKRLEGEGQVYYIDSALVTRDSSGDNVLIEPPPARTRARSK